MRGLFSLKFRLNFLCAALPRPAEWQMAQKAASVQKLAQNWHKASDNRKGSYDFHRNSLKFLVGMTRFELATP